MKSVLFVVCFALGVSLMIYSGYLPKTASARGNGDAGDELSDTAGYRTLPDGLGRSVTRKALPELPPGPEDAAASPPVPDPRNELEYSIDDSSSAGSETLAEPEPGPPEPDRIARDLTLDVSPIAQPEGSVGVEEPGAVTVVPADAAIGKPAPSDPPAFEVPTILADAGPDRVVWVGWNEATLDGSASVGERLSYKWRQIDGPVELAVADPHRAITTVTGLLTDEPPRWRSDVYRFELTVTDANGVQDVDTVEIVAKRAPMVRIKPTPERRFEYRDGLLLGHYISWVTNLETYETVFEVTSELELSFYRVGGGPYEAVGGPADSGAPRFVYQVVIFPQGDEVASWVEFLIDSAEKVPAIVQFGVNWEAR